MVYGERDYWPDGSFVTTEWFVIAWVPIIPIISKRISYTENNPLATYDSSGFYVYEDLPLVRKQVLLTYAFFATVAASCIVWGMYQDFFYRKAGDPDLAAAMWMLWMAVILVLPYFLRRRAKRRKVREWNRQNMGLPPADVR